MYQNISSSDRCAEYCLFYLRRETISFRVLVIIIVQNCDGKGRCEKKSIDHFHLKCIFPSLASAQIRKEETELVSFLSCSISKA